MIRLPEQRPNLTIITGAQATRVILSGEAGSTAATGVEYRTASGETGVAHAGKEVILTERGHPIAVIKPIRDEAAQEATLRAMVDEGFITLATRKGPMPTPSWRPVKVKGQPLSHTVIEDREDRA